MKVRFLSRGAGGAVVPDGSIEWDGKRFILGDNKEQMSEILNGFVSSQKGDYRIYKDTPVEFLEALPRHYQSPYFYAVFDGTDEEKAARLSRIEKAESPEGQKAAEARGKKQGKLVV